MLQSCMRNCRSLARLGVAAPQASARRFASDQETDTNSAQKIEKSVNQVILLGRAGNDAELRGTDSFPVVQFSVATQVHYQKGDETVQNTVWHRVSVFKPGLKDIVYNNLKKGQRVFVQGRLGYYEKRNPEDDTIIHKTASIIAHDVTFVS
ncbi:Single-stranded DNA-binding protein [Trinorchestia longiramus]|nr:Single-stranded DNA-binding protein [Trinorchestia longiramus]